MKSYTDIEQSKKLAEILPLESADMFLAMNGTLPVMSKYIDDGLVTADETAIPCWSLAALMELIPDIIEDYVLRIDKADSKYFIWYDKIGKGWSGAIVHPSSENFIDAAFEMIVWLKENNKL